MKQKVLGKNIEPKCEYCQYGTIATDGATVLCPKKGVFARDASCKKFLYDPLKRVPQEAPPPMPFSERDFSLTDAPEDLFSDEVEAQPAPDEAEELPTPEEAKTQPVPDETDVPSEPDTDGVFADADTDGEFDDEKADGKFDDEEADAPFFEPNDDPSPEDEEDGLFISDENFILE